MKIKPLLTALAALVLSGGMLWAFPTLGMALVLVLLGLIGAMGALIRRSLTVVPAYQGAPPVRVVRVLDGAAPGPAFANRDGTPAKPALDPAAFARFRAHLESVERQRGAPAPDFKPDPKDAAQALARAASSAAPGPARHAAAGDPLAGAAAAVTDRLALSAEGAAAAQAPATPKVKSPPTYGPRRRPLPSNAAPGAPAAPARAKPASAAEADSDAAEEVDLFEDLRPTRKGTLPAKSMPQAESPSGKASPAGAGPPDEAAALLKMAEDANRRGDPRGARAALDQHLALLPDGAAGWPAHRLNLRLAAHDGRPQLALDSFEAMVKAGFELKDDAVPALLDDALQGVVPDLADSLRVSLLLKALAVFRQQGDRAAMDRMYRLLIEAQERVGDERKLVQFLKNHLDIKKSLGETDGQLEIIDQIGNRLFKLGQTAEAREYYELGLKLRAEAKQPGATPASAKTGTTPQTA